MKATRGKNAICINCGEWKTLWNAKCQSCGFRPIDHKNPQPLASLYLSLGRPGSSSKKTEVRRELKGVASAIRSGQPPMIPEAEYNRMIELVRSRRKRHQ